MNGKSRKPKDPGISQRIHFAEANELDGPLYGTRTKNKAGKTADRTGRPQRTRAVKLKGWRRL